MTKRDSETEAYLKTCAYNSAIFDSECKRAFEAGWNARKKVEYEAMLHVKRPLHASAYEPLTPFKPKSVVRETSDD